MMGSMNKRINTLSNRDLRESENTEHNLKCMPSLGKLIRTEVKEHAGNDKDKYESNHVSMGGLVIKNTSSSR